MLLSQDDKVVIKTVPGRKPAIVIVTLDAPDPEAFKGGLYPTAIRHHVEIGFDVYVASLQAVEERHQAALHAMGARLVSPDIGKGKSAAWARFVRRCLRLWHRFGGEKGSKAYWTADQAVCRRLSKSISPVVVLGLQSYQTGMAARGMARRLGVPYLTWEHLSGYSRGVEFSHGARALRAMFLGSHAVLGVSKNVIGAIERRFDIALPQACVMPNSVPAGFEAVPAVARLPWFEKFAGRRFVFAAWTSWRNQNKRLDLLLDAFRLVLKDRPNTALVIAGTISDDGVSGMQSLIAAGALRLTGALSREEVHGLAHRVDACCVPSDTETFGLPMLEALAAGCPVVATRCGGPDEVMDDERFGRLVKVDDVNAFAKAMIEVHDRASDFDRSWIAKTTLKLYGEQAQRTRWATLYATMIDGAKSGQDAAA